MRLGILTSHPIQYQAPWFRGLAQVVDLEVFFAHRQSAVEQGKAGFGVAFEWDVDLLSGYRHRFLKNVSNKPGVDLFFGCDTPEIAEIIGEKIADGRSKIEAGNYAPSPISHLPSPTRFDAFIVTGWHLKSYWQAVRACRRTGVPVLVRGDSQLLTPRSLLKRWAKELVHRALLRQFDGFLTVGQRNREYLAHYGVPPGKIFRAPHFVDNEWFSGKAEIARKQKAEIRQKLEISEDAFCVLFVGKFIPKKRPLDLVAAVQILTAENAKKAKHTIKRPVHLLFVGSGELGTQLRASTSVVFDAESPISQPSTINHQFPPASFAGFKNQSELPHYYAAADVLVLPSDGGETWGLVVNEAMACGLPAVVSDVVGCALDLIEEGQTGFTFPLGDRQALSSRLQQVADLRKSGADLRPALTEKLRVYSVNTAVEGTVEALKKLKSRK